MIDGTKKDVEGEKHHLGFSLTVEALQNRQNKDKTPLGEGHLRNT